MKLVMVGGHARNVGKTSVVAGIIAGLREFNWTAAKITQFGHGVCSVNGKACGWEGDAVGNNCVESSAPAPAPSVPENSCGGVDYHGYCDGNTLVWCQEGQLRTYDCGSDSLSCSWQSDAEGNNCL